MMHRFVDAYHVGNAVNPLGIARSLLIHIQTVIDEGGHPADDAAIRLFIDKLADLHMTGMIYTALPCDTPNVRQFYTIAQAYYDVLVQRSEHSTYSGTQDLYFDPAAQGLIFLLWRMSGAYRYQEDTSAYSQDHERARLAYDEYQKEQT